MSSDRLRVRWEGDDKLTQELRAQGRAAPSIFARAAWAVMNNNVLNPSRHLVPVRDGILRSSATITPVGEVLSQASSGGVFQVIVGYGGPAAPYALAVHENPRAGRTGGISPMGAPYKKHAKVGQWKYLEIPFFAAVPKMGHLIAERVRLAFKARAK